MGIYIDKCKTRKKNKCFICGKPGCYKAKRSGDYSCETHKNDLVKAAQDSLPDPDDGYRSEGELQAMRSGGVRW